MQLGTRLSQTLLVAVVSMPLSAFASLSHTANFCENARDLEHFRERALDLNTRIAFSNPRDGAFGLPTGMCWWHSRFQRSLTYLAAPRALRHSEKPMTQSEINIAISKLISESAVVELRGYKSIHEFTTKNENAIHRKFKVWQAVEALNAVSGLRGRPVVSAKKMQNLMTELYDDVENKNHIAYEMLQYPGVIAHAWLVTHMSPIYENLLATGYELSVVDSNYPLMTLKFIYRFGQTHFVGDFGPFTPYPQWESSLRRYYSAIYHYCHPQAARARVVTNLERTGNHTLASEVRKSKKPVPTDLVKKYTFSKTEFKNLNWSEISHAFEKSNTLAHREE